MLWLLWVQACGSQTQNCSPRGLTFSSGEGEVKHRGGIIRFYFIRMELDFRKLFQSDPNFMLLHMSSSSLYVHSLTTTHLLNVLRLITY